MNKKINDYTEDELYFLLYTPRIEMSDQSQGFIQRFSHEGIVTRLLKRAGDLRGTSERKEKTDKPYMVERPCVECNGARLKKSVLKSKIAGKHIGQFATMEITELREEIRKLDIVEARDLLARIEENLQGLLDVKLGYLNLNRGTDSLSGGEAQRLKLAREIGTTLIELVYIIDEPTSGLHAHDTQNIFKLISKINNNGNTIIMIEHDDELMKQSDYLIEFGPKAGKQGGQIVATGNYREILASPNSQTAKYASKKDAKANYRKATDHLTLENVSLNNLKSVSCQIPLGVLCTFTGVSGSGKSTLLVDAFAHKYQEKVIVIDQSPLQGTMRGNCATYIGVFDLIRQEIAAANEVNKEIFSFNSKGACPDCNGLGFRKIDMHFMGEVSVMCETCIGKRYQPEVLKYKLAGKNIAEILNMTVEEAKAFFVNDYIKEQLQMLIEVGLGYIELGQNHGTFSGGEAQRLKLAKQLKRKGEIYILDEPTAGLHSADIAHLMKLLNNIVDNGNTILAVEHNLGFIANSDWIIDLGPGGGKNGGRIIAQGTPKDVAKVKDSFTGKYLAKYF